MAEALALVSLVSAIVQFIDFGSKVIDRLHEFDSSISEVPKPFQAINNQLPILIHSLKRTQAHVDAHRISKETAKALKPAIGGCLGQVKLLEVILAKTLPAKDASSWTRRLKASKSLGKDKQETNARIFWVHASNKARFEQSYKDIATKLALPGFDDPKVEPLGLVTSWLNEAYDQPWLIALDNVDDLEAIFGLQETSTTSPGEANSGGLVMFLPRSSVGSTIITNRDRHVGLRLVQRAEPPPIEPFEFADAYHFLNQKLHGAKSSGPETKELLESLDYLPLAITQAAALAKENDFSIREYQTMIKAGDAETTDLLSIENSDPARDHEIRNSIFQTWKMSFDQKRQRPRAADILALMVLDRQDFADTS